MTLFCSVTRRTPRLEIYTAIQNHRASKTGARCSRRRRLPRSAPVHPFHALSLFLSRWQDIEIANNLSFWHVLIKSVLFSCTHRTHHSTGSVGPLAEDLRTVRHSTKLRCWQPPPNSASWTLLVFGGPPCHNAAISYSFGRSQRKMWKNE